MIILPKTIIENVNAWLGRYYYWCVFAVSIACLVLGWFLFLQKQYTKIQQSGFVDLRTANTELQKRKTYLAQITSMQEKFNALNIEKLEQLNAVFPEGIDEIDVINTVQSFVDAAQATILSIDVSLAEDSVQAARSSSKNKKDTDTATKPLISNPTVRVAYIVVNIQPQDSSYLGFKTFLSHLDHFTPILNLRQMSYSPETTSYALQLETYYSE